MKKWVWHIGSAVMGMLVAACTNGEPNNASTTLETENSVALVVQLSDGSPAARTKVLVRPADFLAGANNLKLEKSAKGESPVVESDSSLGILNLETDEKGRLNLPRLKPGAYNIEARQDTAKAFVRVVMTDASRDSVVLKVEPTGAVSGQVNLPESESTVTVAVKGLDYFVETDTAGKFKFSKLPKGMINLVGFVYRTYKTLDMNGEPSTISNLMTVGNRNAKIESKKTTEDIVIGQKIVPANDTVIEKDVYPVYNFADFEDSTYGWYISRSKYAEAELDAEKNVAGRKGMSAHFVYQNDSNANWALMGRALNGMVDMSKLDSVEFWARSGLSDSAQWISVSFDVLLDSIALDSTGYENGKAWVHLELDTAWQRFVVTPKDLIEPDEHNIGGNIGWDAVKKHVTNLNFFGGGVTEGTPYEMWVDDITIYGVKNLE